MPVFSLPREDEEVVTTFTDVVTPEVKCARLDSCKNPAGFASPPEGVLVPVTANGETVHICKVCYHHAMSKKGTFVRAKSTLVRSTLPVSVAPSGT